MDVRLFRSEKNAPVRHHLSGPGTVHIWHRSWTGQDKRHADLALLSGDERSRYERYRFSRDADDFAEARAFLRRVLARYCNRAPGRLQFAYGPWGRPELPGSGISFNLSHTKKQDTTHVVVALAPSDANVGIDIETRRELPDLDALLGVLTAEERTALLACPPRNRQEQFLRLWTGKEAVLKALGQGLSRPPDSFGLCTSPPGLVHLDGKPIPESGCTMAAPDIAPGVLCTVAIFPNRFRLTFSGTNLTRFGQYGIKNERI